MQRFVHAKHTQHNTHYRRDSFEFILCSQKHATSRNPSNGFTPTHTTCDDMLNKSILLQNQKQINNTSYAVDKSTFQRDEREGPPTTFKCKRGRWEKVMYGQSY